MTSIAFIADAPEEVTLSDETARSQVQIAKTGRFKDPRYGSFSITKQDFSKWIANFMELSKQGDRLGLPVDVDHSPEKNGNTEAAGWITALNIKGEELWASVEWNSLGKQLITDRRYAYLSPTYHHDYKDEQGRSHGTALVGVALTNRPFLSMATVSLSSTNFVVAAQESYTQEVEMPELKNIAIALSLPEDSDESAVVTAIKTLGQRPEKPVSLETQAASEGKMVLSVADHATLVSNAEAGANAAKTLAEMQFENAFDKALSKGAVVPAQKDDLADLYGKAPDATLKMLQGLQPVVNTVPEGSGSGAGDEISLNGYRKDADGYVLDEDSAKLDAEAQKILSDDSSLSYADAVDKAATKLGLN